MKIIKLFVAGFFFAGNLLAQTFPGYTVNITPVSTVADGVGGEETYIQWEAPFGSITLADFITFYRIRDDGSLNLLWFKQEILRAGDSQYAFIDPGEYLVSYLHFSFFSYYRTASARVSVRSTLALVPGARNYPPKVGPIVAFGDSLTEGVGATRSNLVTWLEAFTGYPIINAGVSGDNTAKALSRITNSVLAYNPSLVIILLGGCDILDQRPVSETFSNLHQIVTLVQNQGAVALVVGVYDGLLADRYREEFHELYLSTHSVFVPDILKNIPENPFLIGNLLHPNDEGYRRMTLRIAPVVKEIMAARFALAMRRSGNSTTVEWPGYTNVVYDVLFSRELNAPLTNWSIINTRTGANAVVSASISATNSLGFIKVRAR